MVCLLLSATCLFGCLIFHATITVGQEDGPLLHSWDHHCGIEDPGQRIPYKGLQWLINTNDLQQGWWNNMILEKVDKFSFTFVHSLFLTAIIHNLAYSYTVVIIVGWFKVGLGVWKAALWTRRNSPWKLHLLRLHILCCFLHHHYDSNVSGIWCNKANTVHKFIENPNSFGPYLWKISLVLFIRLDNGIKPLYQS